MANIELGRFITGDQVCEITTQALLGLASAIKGLDLERGDGKEIALVGIHDTNQSPTDVEGVIDIIREHIKRTRASAMALR